MTDDFTPETEPSGSLDPPRRNPPTAVGAMTPEPEPEPRPRHRHRHRHRARSVHHVRSSHTPLDELLRPVANAVRDAFREIERVLERL